jgi:VWFA-related protein
MRFLQLILIAALGSGLSLGQEAPYTLRVDVPLVSVDVTVESAEGRPLTFLKPRDFTIFEDGIEQEIRDFNAIETPNNILMLFDRSASTEGRWRHMQRAAGSLIFNLREQDRVTLASFDEGLTMLSNWQDSRDTTNRAVDGLHKGQKGGATNLYMALSRAARREFRDVAGRRAMVVLTDGRDNSLFRQILASGRPTGAAQDANFQRFAGRIRDARIPLYFVATNTDRNRSGDPGDDYRAIQQIYPGTTLPKAYLMEVRARMEYLANASGGRVFYPDNIRNIVPIYEQISRDLGASYSLTYISSNPVKAGEPRRIDVRVRKAGVKVRQSRDSYYSR